MRRLVRVHRQVRKPREGSVIRQNVLQFLQVAILSPIALYQVVQHCATICDYEARNCIPKLPKNAAAKLHVPDETLPDYFLKVLPEEVLELPSVIASPAVICAQELSDDEYHALLLACPRHKSIGAMDLRRDAATASSSSTAKGKGKFSSSSSGPSTGVLQNLH